VKEKDIRKIQLQSFIAIDFETADHGHESACSVAMILVKDQQIIERAHHLIRPPRKKFTFTDIHGIKWEDVADKPTFAELWPTLTRILKNVSFFVAHNAVFNQSVLNSCCRAAGIHPPPIPFKCTMELARRALNLYPTKLPDVCRHLKIDLIHHNALSDAEACALIYINLQKSKKVR